MSDIKEFQTTPELNIFFQKLYDLKKYIKEIAVEAEENHPAAFKDLNEIWNRLDSIFLPNNKKMDGQND